MPLDLFFCGLVVFTHVLIFDYFGPRIHRYLCWLTLPHPQVFGHLVNKSNLVNKESPVSSISSDLHTPIPENCSNISHAKSITELFLELTNFSKFGLKKKKIVQTDGNYNVILVDKEKVIVFETFVTKGFEIVDESQVPLSWRIFDTLNRS